MSRTVSTQVKIEQLTGMLGTEDLSEWETKFVENMRGFLPPGDVAALSDRQLEIVERLWDKHFA